MNVYLRPNYKDRFMAIARTNRLSHAETLSVLLDGWYRLPERTRERVLRGPNNAKARSGVAAAAPVRA